MKISSYFYLACLVLATGCRENEASQKLATETEARVVASIQQVLVRGAGSGQADYVGTVRTWYQSDVPNIIKLDPNAAKVYEGHAAILEEVATTQPKLVQQPDLSTEQAQNVRDTYQKLVDESAANVQQMTNLASSKTTMSEAEQRQLVASLATDESKKLDLVRYFGKRTQATLDQQAAKKKSQKYNREVWGHE